VINSKGVVLDGHNRFRICKELKLEPDCKVKDFKNKLEEKQFIITTNLKRRHLNDFQKAELGMALLDTEKKLAKDRMSKGGGSDHQNLPEEEKGQVRDIIANKVGISGTTFERVKKIVEKAPERLKVSCRKGEVSITRIYGLIRDSEWFEKELRYLSKNKRKMFEFVFKERLYTTDFVRKDAQAMLAELKGNRVEYKEMKFLADIVGSEKDAVKWFKERGGRYVQKRIYYFGLVNPRIVDKFGWPDPYFERHR
jgi:hypothetical protein